MKKLFKGTLPTIAILLVAVMSLTTFTYAWFTAGESATVDVVEVGVKDVDGVMISANGFNGTWGSTMTPIFKGEEYNADTKTISVGTYKSVLRDVSCNGVIDPTGGKDATLNFYQATYDNKLDALKAAEKLTDINNAEDANWIQFDIYIKNEGGAKTVTFNTSDVTGNVLSRAIARIAFVQQGVSSATAAVNQNTSPSLTYSPVLLGIWEPNWDEHTTDGETWLKNNAQTDAVGSNGGKATTPATYMAVTKAFDSSIVNVATGENFTMHAGDDLSIFDASTHAVIRSSGEIVLPQYEAGGAGYKDYYVYTPEFKPEAGEHFAKLTADDFFRAALLSEIIDGDGTLKAKNNVDQDLYCYYGSDIYEKVAAGSATFEANKYFYLNNNEYVAITGGEGGNRDEHFYPDDDEQGVNKNKNIEDVYILKHHKFDLVDTNEKLDEKQTYLLPVTVGKAGSAVEVYTKKANENLASVNQLKYDPKEIKVELGQSQIVKLTVFIWLEGQDCDCTNYVSGSDFKVNLNLVATKNEGNA